MEDLTDLLLKAKFTDRAGQIVYDIIDVNSQKVVGEARFMRGVSAASFTWVNGYPAE